MNDNIEQQRKAGMRAIWNELVQQTGDYGIDMQGENWAHHFATDSYTLMFTANGVKSTIKFRGSEVEGAQDHTGIGLPKARIMSWALRFRAKK